MRLTFDEAHHHYWLDGERLPGVTEVLSDLSMTKRLDPGWLAAARERGKLVHKAIELYNQDDLAEDSVDKSIVGYLTAWKRFCHDYKFKPLMTERIVYSERWRFAGTLDVIGSWQVNKHPRLVLADAKSGLEDPAHGPQTAAYVHAAVEMEILEAASRKDLPQRCAVRVQADGYYKLDRFSHPSDWSVFFAALECWKFKQKHGLL